MCGPYKGNAFYTAGSTRVFVTNGTASRRSYSSRAAWSRADTHSRPAPRRCWRCAGVLPLGDGDAVNIVLLDILKGEFKEVGGGVKHLPLLCSAQAHAAVLHCRSRFPTPALDKPVAIGQNDLAAGGRGLPGTRTPDRSRDVNIPCVSRVRGGSPPAEGSAPAPTPRTRPASSTSVRTNHRESTITSPPFPYAMPQRQGVCGAAQNCRFADARSCLYSQQGNA